jgi:alcohol dehydrogenase YqhD (iron-dependent ADH family)
LSFDIVQEEAIRSSMATNEILQGGSHFGFVVHRIYHSLGAVLANIELGHGAAAMTKDAIVMGRGVTKKLSVATSLFH